jgi:hypothetical protein
MTNTSAETLTIHIEVAYSIQGHLYAPLEEV